MPDEHAVTGGAVVTGASTGIGAATLRALVRSGYRVFGTVRRARDAAGVESAGGTPLTVDVTIASSVTRARDTVARLLGDQPLGVLVNNAGVPGFGPLELAALEEWRRTLEVNVLGVVAVTQAFLPMLRAGQGRIVNISSVSGRTAFPFLGPYAASKFALEALSDSLRRELRGTGVRVTVVQPGSVRTPIWSKVATSDPALAAGTVYERAVAAVRKLALDGAERGLPPEAVATAVLQSLSKKRPPERILVVRRGSLAQRLLSVLPDRIVDQLIARQIDRPGR